MNHHTLFLAECRARGLDVQNLTPAQADDIAMHIRTLSEKAAAALCVVQCQWDVNVRGVRVPLTVEAEREAGCRERCPVGAFAMIDGGKEPICLRCNCSGKKLRDKWKHRKACCPLPPEQRLWGPWTESPTDERAASPA